MEWAKTAPDRKKKGKGKGDKKAHFKTFGEGGGQEEASDEPTADSKAAPLLRAPRDRPLLARFACGWIA